MVEIIHLYEDQLLEQIKNICNKKCVMLKHQSTRDIQDKPNAKYGK